MTIPPLSLGLIKGAEWLKALNAEMFTFGQAHGLMNKKAEHTSVHALAGRLQAGPSGNLELTVPASLIKGVFDALDEPGAEFVVRNSRTECAIKVMTKEEIAKLGGVSHISERGHSYHYTLGPIVELPATGDYDKLWAISIKSNDLEDIRKSYGLETSPQLGFYIPVGCKKKRVTESNAVSKLAGVYTASGDKVQGVGLRKMYHSLLEEQGLPGLGVNNEDTGDVELSFDGDEAKRQEVFDQLSSRVQAKTGHPVTFAPVDIPQSSVPVKLTNKDTERLNAIHHLAYRMSNMYDPADPLLDSNDNFKQKLADRFRLQVSPRGIKGTVPSRAAEQLLGTRPMYEGMMPARRTRSEEEALSDMAEEQKRRLMKALSGGRGFLTPIDGGVSKLASLLKESAGPIPTNTIGGSNPSGLPKSNVATSNVRADLAKQPAQYSTPNRFPTSQPGPNYERGDDRGWSTTPGWTNQTAKNRPLPEEAPLGNASADLAMLTPAAPAVGALTQAGIRSLPAATRFAAAGAPLNTAGGVAKGLWNAGSLKAVRNIHPYVNRSMTAANLGGIAAASYEPIVGSVRSLAGGAAKAVEDGRQMADAPGEMLSKYYLRQKVEGQGLSQKTLNQVGGVLPRISEPAFTVRFGEGHLPNAINNYAADAGRRTAEYAAKYYGHYLGNPEGPLETALRYHTPARALTSQLFKTFNNQTGAFNAQPPDYKSLGAAHALSFAGKALKNTAFPGSPGPSINVSPNPLFAKEIISKTPGIPARFISPMLGLKRNNQLTRWADEQGSRLANNVIKQPFGVRPTPVLPELEEYLKSKAAPLNSLKPPNLSNLSTKRVGEL